MKENNKRLLKGGIVVALILWAFGDRILNYFGCSCPVPGSEAQPDQDQVQDNEGSISLPGTNEPVELLSADSFTASEPIMVMEPVKVSEASTVSEPVTVSRELYERSTDDNTYTEPELVQVLSPEKDSFVFKDSTYLGSTFDLESGYLDRSLNLKYYV